MGYWKPHMGYWRYGVPKASRSKKNFNQTFRKEISDAWNRWVPSINLRSLCNLYIFKHFLFRRMFVVFSIASLFIGAGPVEHSGICVWVELCRIMLLMWLVWGWWLGVLVQIMHQMIVKGEVWFAVIPSWSNHGLLICVQTKIRNHLLPTEGPVHTCK